MCGIVGGISNKNITPKLISGLRRLEYRGYDSAGIVVLSDKNKFNRARSVGKVANLERKIKQEKCSLIGNIGIAHTRWATHGKPSDNNAHPHICNDIVGVVHNGIIENYLDLKKTQEQKNYKFTSETDTEIIAHAIHMHMQTSKTLLESVQKAIKTLKGSYGLAVISPKHPNTIIATRKNSPLIIEIFWIQQMPENPSFPKVLRVSGRVKGKARCRTPLTPYKNMGVQPRIEAYGWPQP